MTSLREKTLRLRYRAVANVVLLHHIGYSGMRPVPRTHLSRHLARCEVLRMELYMLLKAAKEMREKRTE